MAASELGKYYDCDPFIPGAFPEADTEIDPRHPLRHFVSSLHADLADSTGQLLVPEGEPVVELGFTAPLHPIDRSQAHIQRMLSRAAGPLRLARMALEGGPIDLMDKGDLSFLRAPFKKQGQLPPVVVAHTLPDVANVAVNDFGFEYTGPSDCAPALREQAIRALGHTPVTVFMRMEQFLLLGV